MKYGAKNKINARVTEVKQGDIMSQVNLEIDAKAAMSSLSAWFSGFAPSPAIPTSFSK